MNILFLSRWFPYPMNNGSKLRIYNLLRGLSQAHKITLLSFEDQPGVNLEARAIQEICSTVKVVRWSEFNPNALRARLAFMSLKPRSIVDIFSYEMANAITESLNHQKFDLIIASQLQMAAYYPYFQYVPALFEELEIGLFHDRAFSAEGGIHIRHVLTWFKLRLYLSRLLKSYKAFTVASKQEYKLLVKNFPNYQKRAEIIPNCLNIDEYTEINSGKKDDTLIFTGSFKYHVNYEAMLWFVGKVFPLILERMPDVHLIITGDHANLTLPSSKNITLTGHVEDIKPLIASSTISLAPLLGGGGTRLKILEAMALGTVVIATSKGAEGLDTVNGEHLLVANSPVEYAECVIRLLNDKDLRSQLAGNASLLVQEKYNWRTALSDYSRLINALV